MRVLSLFDGMSCGQIALKEIGITPEVYYASEIDKFAIKQTQLNFPNTIQVGDVRDLNVEDLGHIDLILAGSPCTDMSFSGKRKGLSTVEGIEIKSLSCNSYDRNNFIIQRALHGYFRIRRLTPTECSRLQTVPDWYKWECSETQQYKMLGNGWTIKVIEHILKRIKES